MAHLEIIRPKELARILSVSISTLYRMTDELPQKFKLRDGGKAVGWLRSDIESYLKSRAEK
jgi:predicted DNA-binding transcriptional regulator AlpA